MTNLTKNKCNELSEKEEKTNAQIMAGIGLSSLGTAANTASLFSKGTFGELGILEVVEVIADQALKINKGDMRGVESMLTAQAVALNSIFTEMARRSAVSMDTHITIGETYMRMALKAQAQCRATLETLAEVKNPRITNFVGQQNNANQQQINNGLPHDSVLARTEKTANSSNELLSEVKHENLDTSGTRTPSGIDSNLEAVGVVNRPKD